MVNSGKKLEKSGQKWQQVARCGYMWFYVAKSCFMSAILDVRNSLSIAILAILHRYRILLFSAAILDVRKSLSIAFLAITENHACLHEVTGISSAFFLPAPVH